MLSPTLEAYVDQLAVELKQELPAAAALTDFALKTKILAKIQEHANAEADAMIAVATLTEIVKSLKALADN